MKWFKNLRKNKEKETKSIKELKAETKPVQKEIAKEPVKVEAKSLETKVQQSFIDKNVNLILLLIIGGVALTVAGITVYAQYKFTDINYRYNEKLGALNKISKELTEKKGVLNETEYKLDIKTKKEEGLTQDYLILKANRDQLQKDKDSLTSELTSTKSELTDARRDLVVKEAAISDLNSKLKTKSDEIDSLNAKIANYKTQCPNCTG